MDGSFEFGDDFFREFSDNVRGNVREKVFNGSIGSVRGYPWEFVDGLFQKVDA